MVLQMGLWYMILGCVHAAIKATRLTMITTIIALAADKKIDWEVCENGKSN